MNIRRAIYLMALVLIGLIVYSSGSDNYQVDPSLSKQSILKEFLDLSNYQPDLKSLPGSYKATDIYFPQDFNGYKGDEFYVTMQDEQNVATIKYIIAEKDAKKGTLVYKLKDIWKDFKPPQGKFETYHWQENQWTKI